MPTAAASIGPAYGSAPRLVVTWVGRRRPTYGEAVDAPIRAGELVALLRSDEPFALLDAREEGVFATSHLLHASSVPLSRLELRLPVLVPDRSTRVVWCDDGSGLAEKAAERAEALGWTASAPLDGGTHGWEAAGLELYSGLNVPSKLFGELVERHYGTPHITAAELARRQARGEPVVILDSRTEREFHRMSIPGGRSCPGGELVHRIHAAVTDPDTLVVVNCAGRTRSIIGAQSLRSAGLPNRVVALENGTMGWELAGFELEHGRTDAVSAPDPPALEAAQRAARAVAARVGVEAATSLDGAQVLDVRTPEEFAAGHLPASRSAPGGQLVQATDEYLAVRNTPVVLVDDDGVRATMAASWLLQMGWRGVRTHQAGSRELVDVHPPPTGLAPPPVATCTVDELNDDADATVLDLAPSPAYRHGHVPGAWWVVRSRLGEARRLIGPADRLVLTSTTGELAAWTVDDVARMWPEAMVVALDGGTAGWAQAGHAIEPGMTRATTATDDVWAKPYDPDDQEVARARMREYLTWEVDLVAQYERDDLARFDLPTGPDGGS
jgi:rhodanese-related sulfurtransferase